MKEDKKKGIGLSFAWNGIIQVIKREKNMRIHCIMALFAICFGFVFQISRLEWVTITIVIVLVFALEMMNSVCERIIDYVKPEISVEAKIIKDMAAGAVLVAAIGSIIIGSLIFIPKMFAFFGI
ncbi:diacylglycerol kinase family protein [Pseudogracilibacillus sp. ICA-222130]|uniref:diacylglycerol kinase family protein n=1 Tax=Pseudogracilibacillus sp. ICA-222130 TaxID=3134655 RepID=UPI0030C51613